MKINVQTTVVILSLLASVAALAWGVLYYLTYAVRSQVLGKTFWRGRKDRNEVALTFDDGPGPDTVRVLDVLRESNTKAAFFIIGEMAKRYPEVVQRTAAEGHEIGNHSYRHRITLFSSKRRTRHELYKAQETISNIAKVSPRYARPPCGVRTASYFKYARQLRLTTVQWTVAGFDWKRRSPEQIANDVLRKVKPGSIVLLHDGDSAGRADRRRTADAIPLILSGLERKNLKAVSLSRLLETDPASEFHNSET